MPWYKKIAARIRKKSPFRFVYSDDYWMADIGNHLFPLKKYRLIYEHLLAGGAGKKDFICPEAAAEEDLLRVHTDKYLRKLRTGRLSSSEIHALEIPYSQEMYGFARLHAGGTIKAAEAAMEQGLAVHIGGGFHHAFAGHGEGFCMLNDVAVAAAKILEEKRVKKIMIVDCDVHQGNGTASIFSGRDSVFTFSIHQMDLYPADKPESDLDIGLWSGDGDKKYLEALRKHFPCIYESVVPDLVFYLAGADPYEKDQLGGLSMTKEGLKERGKIVIGETLRLKIPLVVLLAGGYAFDVEDTVQVHLQTIETARRLWKKIR